MKLAKYFHEGPKGKLQCEICPRACELGDGQRGFCQGRKATSKGMELLTYGKTSGLCLDPIEKKPLYHFLPGSQTLSFGTIGCNLNCQFCQNWRLSRSTDIEDLSSVSSEEIVNKALTLGAKSVSFTYNEPITFIEFAIETAKLCHQKGLKTIAVTAGYIQGKAREDFFREMDATNVDLKAFSQNFYEKYTSSNLDCVLETLKYIKDSTQTWLEITNLLIPGANDSEDEIERMTRWILNELGPNVPLHFSAFHPDYKFLDRERTSLEILSKARQIALRHGLHYVYTGNVYYPEGQQTLCPQCKNELVEREAFCPKCHYQIAGVFL